jgi:hypothetical protein
MVARVTQVKVKPEDVADSVRLFGESVVPAAEQEEGFVGALLLTREDGRALVIDVCDTLEHMRENERNGFYQTQISKFAERIVDRPRRDFFEVKVAKGARGGPELLETIE